MKLKQWCEQDERIGVELSKEYWKMEVGLPHSEKKINELEKQGALHAHHFLNHFKKPKELFYGAVGSIVSEQTFKLYLDLNKARQQKICSKKYKVCWPAWRQWAMKASDKARKEVFDEFVKKTPLISDLIKQRFELSADLYSHYGLNPLALYVEDHKMSLKKLRSVIEQLNKGTKKPFLKQWKEYSLKFLGREPRYYDDMYFMRNKIFEDLVKHFKGINPLKQILKTMRAMGLDASKVRVDSVDRPKKAPSPFCMFVKIPDDIRISFKAENPLQTTESLYHEFGHAIHASTIRRDLPYWKKNGMSEGLCETFSTLFEGLMQDPNYTVNELGLKREVAEEFAQRLKFNELFAINFYCANSFFRIDYWDKKLDFDKCNDYYAKQIKRCINMKYPGAYWQLHHILPEDLMYVPSYLLSMTRSFDIDKRFKEKYGEWWKSKKAGKELVKIMEIGTDSPAADFSKLSVKNYVGYFNDKA